MIADIFFPIFTLKNTVLACFIRKKKKLFGGFAPTPSPGHHPGPPGGFQFPPGPHLQSFLGFPKTNASIFFVCYPLTAYPISCLVFYSEHLKYVQNFSLNHSRTQELSYI